MTPRPSTTRGFKRTASLLGEQIRRAGESRGFAVSRVLTHWDEIAGPEIAAICRPVKISYARGGFGATLTVLAAGAHAPMVEMQKERLRERVNAIYGYNAISRVRITQTAPTGFSEGQAVFAGPKPKMPPDRDPSSDPQIARKAAQTAAQIEDHELRSALERLARNVLSRGRS